MWNFSCHLCPRVTLIVQVWGSVRPTQARINQFLTEVKFSGMLWLLSTIQRVPTNIEILVQLTFYLVNFLFGKLRWILIGDSAHIFLKIVFLLISRKTFCGKMYLTEIVPLLTPDTFSINHCLALECSYQTKSKPHIRNSQFPIPWPFVCLDFPVDGISHQ